MPTLDGVQPHWISRKSSVALEWPRVRILYQYLCGTEIPDLPNIAHKVQKSDSNCEMQCIWALINCGTTSLFMALRLLTRLGMSYMVAHITTLGLNGGVMQHANDSQKTQITVKYLVSFALADKSNMLLLPICVCVLVRGLPWFQKRHPDIDRAHR
jgi:hypothetical protein